MCVNGFFCESYNTRKLSRLRLIWTKDKIMLISLTVDKLISRINQNCDQVLIWFYPPKIRRSENNQNTTNPFIDRLYAHA
ncbi:hypothetical protein TUM4445_35770 [Shewanella sp. MBTL60-112-B2]|nr:hypothetical protein TUM4444_38120 [Shewanella sp. MBTL60-112-B1]GIU39418.1 hypothetical protein TUM4445_35770 [Shewanella sp. MBTL60-112-B2]